ncbi:S9 family peptidase [Chryseobacterium indologenes]|uniref:S9 family peptidase n=1 Tax=Chryseobacterium indologenes TaxID=253 RepID=UPI000B519BDD|nr:prolyl oligopeptidase family serine peptidase [Chryseobacterium indologenes]ASE62029.1 S9 family peptidase [Chryseobacterium indologenes]
MKSVQTLLMILCSIFYYAQIGKTNDTLKRELSKFYTVSNLVISDDGKWSSIRKVYSNNVDTVLVFRNSKPEVPTATLVGLSEKRFFLKDSRFFASGSGKALLMNLNDGRNFEYKNVKSAAVLSNLNRYFMFYNDDTIHLYDGNGKKIFQVESIEKFPVTDNLKKLIVLQKNESSINVLDLSDKNIQNLYQTKNPIVQMEISRSGNYLLLAESNIDTGDLKSVVIQLNNKVISYPIGNKFIDADNINYTEIQDNGAFLIDFQTRHKSDSKIVDIWYGNDSNLKAKNIGCIQSEYYLYDNIADKSTKIPTDRYPSFASINSSRYLIAFNSEEDYNYITHVPLVNYYLFDLLSKTYQTLSSKTLSLSYSPNGQFLVLFNEENKDGKILDLNSNTNFYLPSGLTNPVFSMDNRTIFFESKEDFWWFDTKTGTLNKLGENRKSSTILNYTRNSPSGNYSSFSINKFSNILNNSEGALFSLKDKGNRSSIFSFKDGKVKLISDLNPNYISSVKSDTKQHHNFIIEENYNIPPRLIDISVKNKQEKVIYQSNKSDNVSKLIRQEIISFKNKDNEELKGVLYYPIDFNPQKKYPMIVTVYQYQYDSANKYPVLGISFIGYDRRTLLQRGYFVYEPDISTNKRGMGLSALDCVNSALDAVSSNINIDMKKVGLTGHSFGSYETNFIATQSKRFAAYISSSGFSDIVRAYFSYNYNFNIPDYARIENGQQQLPPYKDNKMLYFQNNPINFVDQVSAPILLWAGMQDKNVPWQHTQEFYIGLKRNGKQVIALFYPNQSHTILNNTAEAEDLQVRILEWWDYFLKDQKNVPWIDKQIDNKKGCN